ncbi:MAG: hypothetical protein ACTS6G_02665 [Candidatus Hodgkinia cicadicola]
MAFHFLGSVGSCPTDLTNPPGLEVLFTLPIERRKCPCFSKYESAILAHELIY